MKVEKKVKKGEEERGLKGIVDRMLVSEWCKEYGRWSMRR